MPPVLHIALDKLSGGGGQQEFPRDFGRRMQKRQHILKLIPKTEGTTRLVEGGSGPEATSQCLIKQPTVHDDIDSRIRSLDLHSLQEAVPPGTGFGKGRFNLQWFFILADQRSYVFDITALTEHHDNLGSLMGFQDDNCLQRNAGILSHAASAG